MSKRKGLKKETKELYTSLIRSLFLCFVALFAIATATVAWFAKNDSVESNSGDIVASNTVMYILGCKGNRSEIESEHLLMQQGEEPFVWGDSQLSLGYDTPYPSYIDTGTGNIVNEGINLYTQSGEFAWCLTESISFYPGARGKLDIYVIPKVEGLTSINLKLDLLPCISVTDENEKTGAVVLEDAKLNKLIKGHILLFRSLNDNTGYSDWLGTDYSLAVHSNEDTFKVNIPYKVTVYWIWPKQYRNLIYDKFSTRGDLFSNTVNNSDYNNLLAFVNSNKDSIFFSTDENVEYPNTSDQMSQANFDYGVQYYNQADEYIGKNVKYIYVRVTGE